MGATATRRKLVITIIQTPFGPHVYLIVIAGPPGMDKDMKIAQIAPLMESVPPRLYGGTERIVSYLTDELVRLGHEVTLFASADSVTAAELVSCASMALRLDDNVRDPIPYYMLMLDRVRPARSAPGLKRWVSAGLGRFFSKPWTKR
jgi:hypothetical protein